MVGTKGSRHRATLPVAHHHRERAQHLSTPRWKSRHKMDRDTHRPNAHLQADILRRVDVDLVEVDVLGLLRELLEDGRDDLARATPRCPEIEDGGLVAVDLQITPEDT